jgi:hypothetical protein
MDLEVENSGPPMTLTFRPPLANGVRVRAAEVSDGARLLAGAASRRGAYEVSVVCPAGRTSRVRLYLATLRR